MADDQLVEAFRKSEDAVRTTRTQDFRELNGVEFEKLNRELEKQGQKNNREEFGGLEKKFGMEV